MNKVFIECEELIKSLRLRKIRMEGQGFGDKDVYPAKPYIVSI